MISLRLPEDVLRALDAFRDEQTVKPSQTAVIIEALRRFLADNHSRKGRK